MDKIEVKTIIRSLLSARTSSCGIYTLNKDFKEETGIDIPLFGYTSLSEYLDSIPDTVKLTGVFPVQEVTLVNNNTSAHIVSLVERQRKNKKSKKGVTGNPERSVIKKKSNESNTVLNKKANINQNKLQNLSGKEMKLQDENIESQNATTDGLPNAKQSDTSQKKVSEKNNSKFKNTCGLSVKSNKKQMKLPIKYSQEANGQMRVSLGPLLQTADPFIKTSAEVPIIDLRLHASVGEYVEVYPCEISDPSLFYLHLRPFKRALTAFMDKLQNFYDEHEKNLNVKEVPNPNEVFAVRYSRHGDIAQWHRVQVEEILSRSLVVVRFIDYGTTAKILVKNIRLLLRDFVSLPRQAVSGSLANIKPKDGSEWSKAAVRRFHEIAFCRDLVGGVVSMDHQACSLNVALSSTVGEELHVNDTLVDEGLAEFNLSVVENVEVSETKKPVQTLTLTKTASFSYLPAPVFFSDKENMNNRLQKMFTV